jgi:hypothetical protein
VPRPVPPPPGPRNQYGTYYTETEYTQGIQIIPIPYETPTRDQSEDPTVMYHGTPEIASAYDIYRYNRWLVGTGHGNQAGIYMTPEFDEAANSYAKEDGAIIMLYVDPTWGKEKTTSTYYVFVVPNPQEGAFYGIGAIDPLGVLGKDGQRIA